MLGAPAVDGLVVSFQIIESARRVSFSTIIGVRVWWALDGTVSQTLRRVSLESRIAQ